jgi:glycosyltransferase involved in cell wall biosynthesis
VVVGKKKPYARLVEEKIDHLKLNDRVIFLEGLPFADLPSIYQMASAFVYPSFYEGFGIPILEALYSQVAVIAATGSCLEEAGGPNSLYVHPEDSSALAVQVNYVLGDEQMRKKMIASGIEYVRKFDDGILAKQMMDCYLKTLNNNFVSC